MSGYLKLWIMRKVIEKNIAEIIILIVIIVSCSSCYTVKEMTMSDNTKATQCAWFKK